MRKITNISHYISKCRNKPKNISDNIHQIIHLAKIEALMSGYGENIPEIRLRKEYKKGLESLSGEI